MDVMCINKEGADGNISLTQLHSGLCWLGNMGIKFKLISGISSGRLVFCEFKISLENIKKVVTRWQYCA